MTLDPLSALADYLDGEATGPACVIEILCDAAAAIVAEVDTLRALEAKLRRHVDLSGHGCWARDLVAAVDTARALNETARTHDRAGGSPLTPPVRAPHPALTSPGAGWGSTSGGAGQPGAPREGPAAPPPDQPEGRQP